MGLSRREQGLAYLAWGVEPTELEARQPGLLRAAEAGKRQRAPSAVPSEFAEQCTVVSWWERYSRTRGLDPRLLLMIPNGLYLGDDHQARARRVGMAKRAGLRNGAPDLLLAIPRGAHHGLFIEMKRTDAGRAHSDQLTYHDLLRAQGYVAGVCYGADEAIPALQRYLDHTHG